MKIRDERTILSLIQLSKTVDKFSMSMQEDFLSILTVVKNRENEKNIWQSTIKYKVEQMCYFSNLTWSFSDHRSDFRNFSISLF